MKRETIEEYLARGGQVVKVPPKEQLVQSHQMNPSHIGPAVILTYGDADLYYGEVRARKAKKGKPVPKIDFSALPEALRKKYTKELLDDEEE